VRRIPCPLEGRHGETYRCRTQLRLAHGGRPSQRGRSTNPRPPREGVTVDRCHVLAAPGMPREAFYVAMTRGAMPTRPTSYRRAREFAE
jgi:hypothetical protein